MPPPPPTPPVPVGPAVEPVPMRRFGDHAATRAAVFDNALSAAQSVQPVDNGRYRLSLHDVAYRDQGDHTPDDVKKAILENRTLSRRLAGTVRMTDLATNKVVDERAMTLASVPHLTDYGTFLLDGNPTPLSSQMRLDPGLYARRKDNGQVEVHVNAAPGTGASHRLALDSESGVIKVEAGQAEIPVYPLLRALGADHADIEKALGPKLAAANAKAAKPQHLAKLLEKLGPRGPVPEGEEAQRAALANALGSVRFDPWVMQRTMGVRTDRYTKEAALAAAAKAVKVFRGESDPDDRDSLAYQTVWGPEHLIGERLARSSGALKSALWRATTAGSLKRLPIGFLNAPVRQLFMGSGLATSPEGANALEYVDHGARITKVGEGGLGRSADSVPRSSREVHPSQYLYIDPVKSPECWVGDAEVMTRSGWSRWDDVTADTEFACLIDGRLEYHVSDKLHVSDYTGTMYGAENDFLCYLVTPGHRFHVRCLHPGSEMRWTTAEDIHGKDRQHRIGGHLPEDPERSPDRFVVPRVAASVPAGSSRAWGSHLTQGERSLRRDTSHDICDFAEFLGWYLGEGSFRRTRKHRRPAVAVITQSKSCNPENCDRLETLLRRMGYPGTYTKGAHGFLVSDRALAEYCSGFGESHERWIPEEAFSWSAAARERLAESLMLAEGRRLNKRVARGGERWTFTTTSPRLAEDYSRLLFTLGWASRVHPRPDSRGFRTTYEVIKYRRHYRQVMHDGDRRDTYTVQYSGKVYCATVPGGMLYCRYKHGNGLWSGNSEAAGIDLRVAFGTRIGSDRRLYAPVRDAKTGRIVYRSPRDLADATLAFPQTYERAADHESVPAVAAGRLTFVPRREAAYVAPSMEQTFSPLSNLVPYKSSIKGQRASMAGRMISQSLPLVNPESPLVRTGVPGQPGKSFEDLYGRHAGAVLADQQGVVERVDPTRVVVRYADGSRKEHHYVTGSPVGRKSGLDQTPVVKPGDAVAPGQLLARSNYTDDKGHAAYGANARVAYMPYLREGKATYEDAVVVGRHYADRLTSEHLYRHDFDATADGLIPGKSAYAAAFPGRHPPHLLKNYDADGVIKPGTTVDADHPLVLAVRRQDGFGVGRTKKAGLTDASLHWEHSTPGVVQDVVRRKDGIAVTVRTKRPMEDGDKLSGRHGNKGIVHVVDTADMPVGADGKPFDVLMSPLGIISRINPSAVLETWLGKLAAARGTHETVQDWGPSLDNLRDVRAKLSAAGLSGTETVTDPRTGRKVPNVLTGVQYVMKLHHMGEDKAKGRGLGAYDETGAPMRGQSGRAGRMSMGDSDALLGHGANEVLKDARFNRGQQNLDFWLAYRGGYEPARPNAYRHYDRFLEHLRAGGIDPTKVKGDRTQLMPLSPARVREMAGDREVTKPETVDPNKDDAPVKGGLFDPELFGDPTLGPRAEKWAKISLPEAYPSPTFEDPVRRLLGLTEREYRDVLAGRGKVRGRTGPGGLADVLRSFDVKAELAKARGEFQGSRKTAREAAARKLQYLKAMDRTGTTPADWLVDAVPVLPPSFRPVRRQAQTNALTVHDQNVVYSELMHAKNAYQDLAGRVSDTGDERLAVYDAVKAAYGIGAPISPESRAKDVKGVLDQVFGGNRGAKGSHVQQKLLGTPVDLSGRGVILPNPDLNLDQMGVPEAVAWDLYEPFVSRSLVRQGFNPVEAMRRTRDRDPAARRALEQEMGKRPVISTRYPVLHKYNTMAFHPTLVPGSSIHLNTLVNKGFNADFNGDSCRTPLLPVLVNGTLFLGDFEKFIQENALTGYQETTAVEVLGRCTTVLEFRDDADIRVPGIGTDGSVGWRRVNCVSIHTSHGPVCYQVKTERGMDAVFTAHHNFVVLDAECRFVPSKTGDVAVGSLLPTVFGLDLDGTNVTAPGRPELPLSYETGFFLGHYLGDGSLTGREDTVSQASRVPELLDYIEDLGRAFSPKRPWREGSGNSSRWTDVELFSWLSSNLGRGFADKFVPGWCVMAPRPFREGLLVGFLTAEGSRRTGGATAEVANRPLLLAMQMVASTLGISSQVRPGKPARKSDKTGADLAPTFVLWVNQKGLSERIGYWPAVAKVRKFRDLTSRGSHQKWDRVPYPASVSERINKISRSLQGGKGRWAVAKGRPSATKSGQFVSAADRKSAEATGVCTRAMARKLARHYDLSSQGDEVLTRWLTIVENENLMWDSVTSVEVTDRPDVTYDFHVPDGETFCVDGFYVTHNTMSLHVPLSDEAVRDAREKMLPSRNLYSLSDFKPKNYLPTMEFLQGLHYATTADAGNHPVVFKTRSEAVAAAKAGRISHDARVEILDPTS